MALTAGRSCSQDSVDMNLLRYLHRKQHNAKSQDSFTFYLLDGENPSAPEHFHISVKHQEKSHYCFIIVNSSSWLDDFLALTRFWI